MRITELQSVIAELTRKLNKVNNNTIIEEEEEGLDEEHEDDEHGQLIEDDDARSGSTSDLEVQGKCVPVMLHLMYVVEVYQLLQY